ncbi:MAG TPA: hypothetical protein PLX92_02360 [Anaerolineaceae bacterium]|nr:hypothetical protein [Anaerolineaceae bacterium]
MLFLRKTAHYWITLLSIVGVVGLVFLNLNLSEQFVHQDEFAPRWVAAKQWMTEGTSPYDREVFEQTQALWKPYGYTSDRFSQGYYLDLVWNLFLFLPFSFLPYLVARAIWMTIISLALFFSIWFGFDLAGVRFHPIEKVLIALPITLSYPSFKLILNASILPLYVFFMIIGTKKALEGRSTAAGIYFLISVGMFPLSLILAIFFAIWLGSRRDSGFLSIYLSGLAFLLVTSLILFPGWIPEWFANFVQVHPDLSWVDTPLMRVAAFFPGAYQPLAISLHVLTLFMLLVEWYGLPESGERQIRWKALLTLNLISFLNPTSSAVYLLLVWPGLFLFFEFLDEKWKIGGKIVSWTVFLILLNRFWTDFQNTQNWSSTESTVVSVLLPIVALIGLEWTRWWAMESPKPLIEE